MTSSLLDLDLGSIAEYNSHGGELVAAIKQADIAAVHHPVILGMFAVYSILIAIGHLDEDDIVYPPYAIDRFNHQRWIDIGLDVTVVSILALLPYPNDDRYEQYGEPWHLDTSALALSYLGEGEMDQGTVSDEIYAANRCFEFVGRDLIPPHHVRLTTGGQEGNNYIYDTKTGKIIILNYNSYLYEDIGRQHLDSSYTELLDRFHPAQDIMSQWVRNIYDLVYIPWCLATDRPHEQVIFEYEPKTGEQLHPPKEKIPAACSEPQRPGFAHQDRLAYVNFPLALRNIYRTHGWPDRFDKATCWAALERFQEKRQALERAVREARLPTREPGVQYAEEVTPKAVLLTFLQEHAGELAIEGNQYECRSCDDSLRMLQQDGWAS